MIITIVGGTGDLGFGLALRLANKGYNVIIGSRNKEKAETAVQMVKEKIKNTEGITGYKNEDAVQLGEIIVLSVPSRARKDTIEGIKPYLDGKILLDVTVPLVQGFPTKYDTPAAGSNAEDTLALLGETVKVVAGFHSVSASLLADLDRNIESDVLLAGDDLEAKKTILNIVSSIGIRCFDVGPLYQSRTIEGLTPILISLNKQYKKKHLGIRIIGID